MVGVGAAFPFGGSSYESRVSYHLGVFVIRMLDAEAAKKEGEDALEVEYMEKSIRAKRALSGGS